ncbi:hypothetical protein GOV07_01920 [Candidatus Woesearchaeota archaeon]|nr:hypothetical protein [Candidatus Woesearchaeota archaeon]
MIRVGPDSRNLTLFDKLSRCISHIAETRAPLKGDELIDAMATAYAKVIVPYLETSTLVRQGLYDNGSIRGYVDDTVDLALRAARTGKVEHYKTLDKRRIQLYPLITDVDWAFPKSSSIALLTRGIHLKHIPLGQRTRKFNYRVGFVERILSKDITAEYVRLELAGDHPQAGEEGPIPVQTR